MLAGVFGTSTPYAYWGFTAVRHVMEVLYGDHYHIHCTSITDLRKMWDSRDGKPVVFTSDLPDPEISALFIGTGAPLIAFLDEPQKAIAFAKTSRNLSTPDAIRFASFCFSSLDDVLRTSRTFCFGPQYLREDIKDIFRIIFEILTGGADSHQIEAAMHRAVYGYRQGQFTTAEEQIAIECAHITLPSEAFALQTDRCQNLIAEVSATFWPIYERKQMLRAEWPRELFLTCEQDNQQGLINLTGPARFLIWGPYLHLPMGKWIAKVEFEVAENISGADLQADIYDGRGLLVVAAASLPARGIFFFELPFEITSSQQEIEIRIFLLKGAIEGKFYLRSVSVRRAAGNERHLRLSTGSEAELRAEPVSSTA